MRDEAAPSPAAEEIGSDPTGPGQPQAAAAGGRKPTSPRDALLDAAIAAILESGYYRASSNEIARRAGVSWGAIQYHFGSREAIMLATLERDFKGFIESLESVDLSSPRLDDRARNLADFLLSYFERDEYLAILQIELNLTHDPQKGEDTNAAMRSLVALVPSAWLRLLREGLKPHIISEEFARRISLILSGLGIRIALLRANRKNMGLPTGDPQESRQAIIEMVIEMIEREPAEH